VNGWLDTCRLAVEDVRDVLVRLPSRSDREPVVGDGEGGDETTAIDAAVEEAVVARLEASGLEFTLVSEELGRRGDGSGAWVVLDPIDGSINAKRRLPFFSLSLAVAEGETMDDVVFGYVYDFGSGEEWTAERGGGARLNVPAFVGLAHRLRIFGSLAIALCHLADGRVDGVCSLKPARSVDIAAAQLLVRERGLAIDLPDDPPFGSAALDLEGRSRVAAAGTAELCGRIATALSAAARPE